MLAVPMMTLALMMCGFDAFGKHRIVASETGNIIMRKHNSISPMMMLRRKIAILKKDAK